MTHFRMVSCFKYLFVAVVVCPGMRLSDIKLVQLFEFCIFQKEQPGLSKLSYSEIPFSLEVFLFRHLY